MERAVSLDSFVNELVLAWRKLLLYRPSHPARAGSVERAFAIAAGLVAPTGELAFGIGRGALVGAEETLRSPCARRLAEALQQRGVAILRFAEGLTLDELTAFLDLLPRHPGAVEAARMWEEAEARGLQHIRVEPFDYAALRLSDEPGVPDARGSGSRALWDQVLRRLLTDEGIGAGDLGVADGQDADAMTRVLAILRQVLERHTSGEGPTRAVSLAQAVGRLGPALSGAVASHLGEAADQEARLSALWHVAELLEAIPDALREGVLDAAVRELVSRDEAADSLPALTASVSAANVVGALRRLRAERVAFAPRSLRLIEALAAEAATALHADPGTRAPAEAAVEIAPEELARRLRSLFAEEDVDRFHPAQGEIDRLVLELPQRVAAPEEPPPGIEERLDDLSELRQLRQLAATLFDLLRRPLLGQRSVGDIAARLESVFRTFLLHGRFIEAIAIIEELRAVAASRKASPELREAAARCLEPMGQRETVEALVESLSGLPETARVPVQRLIELLGSKVVRELLLTLAEEQDLSRRRRTFDLLASLGGVIAPEAVALLEHPQWYVVRNMLGLLRQSGQPLTVGMIGPGLTHADARVRLEAVKCLAGAYGPVSEELLAALVRDRDAKVAEAAVGAIGTRRLTAGRAPLLALLRPADPLGRQRAVRVKALQAIAELGDESVLPEIKHFFRAWLPVVTADEARAAFASLERYPEAARRPFAERGLRATDPQVRALCQRLLRAAPETTDGA
jgi:hypothetical protein